MVEGELMSMAKPMNPWNGTQLPVGVPLPNDPYATEPPHVDTLITRTEKPYTGMHSSIVESYYGRMVLIYTGNINFVFNNSNYLLATDL